MDKQQQNFGTEAAQLKIRQSAAKIIDVDEVAQEFKRLLLDFKRKIFMLNSRWARAINYNEMLRNAETSMPSVSILDKFKRIGLAEIYNKKGIALRLAFVLYKKLESSPQEFYSSRQEFTTKITEFYSELGENIKSLTLPKQNEVLVILSPIMKVINNPQIVASYIVTHYTELMQKIDRMNDKKIASKLRHTIMVLSNMEIKELDRCISDVRSWPYRGAYGINLYIERTFLLLNGGKSKYDGEAFLGFRLHFRDKELVTVLLKAPQFRKLMTYRQEIEFFVEARNAIQKSVETEGKWEGFYAFYNKLDENIRKVRDVYGNDQFAKILEVFKEKKHEAPIDWENELYMLYEDLIKKAYQLVVEPAARALIGIFEARIKKIEEGKVSALNELRKLLKEKDELYKTKREFAKILRKKRERLLSELKKDRLEFEALIREIVLAMPEFESKFNQITQHKNLVRDLLVEFAILDTSIAWENFTSSNMVVVDEVKFSQAIEVSNI